MVVLEVAKEGKSYKFFWEVIGFDLFRLAKIRSPRFRVSFEVTEWYMELDTSKLQNIDSHIPFRLQRVPGIGPSAVTLGVTVIVKLSQNGDYGFTHKQVREFSDDGFWDFDIDLNTTAMAPKTKDVNWLTSKNILITVKIESTEKTDTKFPSNYWFTKASKAAVLNDLKKLRSTDSDPKYHDLVLNVPEKEFQLHKCILKARWPKLASILEIGKPSTAVEIRKLPDVPSDMLEHLLNFAYYGDFSFMHELHKMKNGFEVFDLVKKYNFYRLNDQISQLSSTCSSSQILQSYRTSVEMMLTNVTSKENALGDFRTCEIPLKPKKLPRSQTPIDVRKLEKYGQHIKFMDLRVYIDKGPYGYNWLMFSVVLGKIPEGGSVTINCRLYVVDESNEKHLLTEEHLVFDEKAVVPIKTPFSKGKESKRYLITSKPVITLEDLIDEQKCLVRKRVMNKPSKVIRQEKSRSIKSRKPNNDDEIWFDTESGKAKNGFCYTLESEDGAEMKGDLSPPESEKEESEEKADGTNLESEEPKVEKDLRFRFEIKLADGEDLNDMRHGEREFMYEDDEKIYQDLKSMCEDEFTDIELQSKDIKIKAHKAMLAARSPAILNAIPKKQTKLLNIGIKPEYLQAFVHYLYTGHIKEIPLDDIDHLLSVAEEYKVKCLADLLRQQRNKLKLADVA